MPSALSQALPKGGSQQLPKGRRILDSVHQGVLREAPLRPRFTELCMARRALNARQARFIRVRALSVYLLEINMSINRSTFLKLASMTVLGAAAMFGAAAASANGSWSIGIAAPGVTLNFSEPGPRYYAPAPVYSRPAPDYYQPAPPVYYRPPPAAYYAPAPVYYERGYHRHEGRRFHRRDSDDDRRGHGRGWEGDRDRDRD